MLVQGRYVVTENYMIGTYYATDNSAQTIGKVRKLRRPRDDELSPWGKRWKNRQKKNVCILFENLDLTTSSTIFARFYRFVNTHKRNPPPQIRKGTFER